MLGRTHQDDGRGYQQNRGDGDAAFQSKAAAAKPRREFRQIYVKERGRLAHAADRDAENISLGEIPHTVNGGNAPNASPAEGVDRGENTEKRKVEQG